MALWDDITKGAKDAAAFTVKKTEELTSVAKLKISIHSEESDLDKCYCEIGSMYYDFHKNGTDRASEISSLMAEADERNIKISALKESLAKAQKSTICPACGAQVTNDYIFCPLCGCNLKASDKSEQSKDDGESDKN